VGLAQAELERRGIVTGSITMLPEVTARIGVPRSLEVPFPLGYPLGVPNEPGVQRAILGSLIRLLESDDVPVVGRFTAASS
jgi:hypothetical protein